MHLILSNKSFQGRKNMRKRTTCKQTVQYIAYVNIISTESVYK